METTLSRLEMVKQFHETFGLSIKNRPVNINHHERNLRIGLIKEELNELKDACEKDGIHFRTESLDALLDLEYVLLGTVLSFGFESVFDEAFREVHRSNMSKSMENIEEARKEFIKYNDTGIKCEIMKYNDAFVLRRLPDGKILKPSGYRAVDLRLFTNISDNT